MQQQAVLSDNAFPLVFQSACSYIDHDGLTVSQVVPPEGLKVTNIQ